MFESFIIGVFVLFIFSAYIAIRIMICFYRYIITRFTYRLTNEEFHFKKCVNPINYN
jgi:hypothetical protein